MGKVKQYEDEFKRQSVTHILQYGSLKITFILRKKGNASHEKQWQ